MVRANPWLQLPESIGQVSIQDDPANGRLAGSAIIELLEAAMVTIPIKTRLEANGTLSLSVPTGLPESDVEVVVIIQPVSDSIATWPEGFFEQTYGAFAEQPLARAPQGEFDARDTLH